MEYIKTTSDILLEHIKEKYGTIYAMSKQTGIPYMTISTVIKRGVENSLVRTVYRIITYLDILIEELFQEQVYETLKYQITHNQITQEEILQILKDHNLISKDYEKESDTAFPFEIRYKQLLGDIMTGDVRSYLTDKDIDIIQNHILEYSNKKYHTKQKKSK